MVGRCRFLKANEKNGFHSAHPNKMEGGILIHFGLREQKEAS